MLDFSAGNLLDDVTMLVVRAGRPAKGTGDPKITPAARATPSAVQAD
jgi:hypothetical protein